MSTFAVTIVLLMVIVSSRFGRYLNEAVTGRISADVLFSVMALRVPVILELVIPLSFFIALLFALGRLYIDSEMTALSACGFSRKRLLAYVTGPSSVVAAFVASLSLWLSPLCLDLSNSILERERARSEFETLAPGQFQSLSQSGSVIYAESLSDDRKVLNNVFAAELNLSGDIAADSDDSVILIKAQSGEQVFEEQYQRRYLRITRGERVEGQPGGGEYRTVDFETYSQLIEEIPIRYKAAHDRQSTLELFEADDAASVAALHWRFGLPVLVLVLALLGVPLAHTDPRRGRYTKMIPAVLLYMIYLVALNAGRGAIEDEKMAAAGLWFIHAGALLVAVLLFNGGGLRRVFANRKREVHRA